MKASDRVEVDAEATANIVLMDGKTMTFADGIHVSPGSTQNIYGGVNGTGKLYVDRSEADTAALGGNKGENGGCGIGCGSSCWGGTDSFSTVDVTINGGVITARAGEIRSENPNRADPGAAIGTGGYEDWVTVGGVGYESYFTGGIWFNGGTITAYGADVSQAKGTSPDTIGVNGTTSVKNRDWYKDGKVYFNGSTIDMYPGAGVTNGTIKQMVKASDTKKRRRHRWNRVYGHRRQLSARKFPYTKRCR